MVAAHLLGVRAVILGLDVLALELVPRAAREVVGHDGDVLPPRRVPVRVVVALLGTLLARPFVIVDIYECQNVKERGVRVQTRWSWSGV